MSNTHPRLPSESTRDINKSNIGNTHTRYGLAVCVTCEASTRGKTKFKL